MNITKQQLEDFCQEEKENHYKWMLNNYTQEKIREREGHDLAIIDDVFTHIKEKFFKQ